MIDGPALLAAARLHDLEKSEHRVAAHVRGFLDLNSSQWLEIENSFLRLALDAASLDEKNLPAADGVADVPVALLSRAMAGTARDTTYPTNYFRSLAALTFAGCANFPTAGLVARAALGTADCGPFERWALSSLAESPLRLSREDTPPELVTYARAEDKALQIGDERSFQAADDEFSRAAVAGSQQYGQSDSLLLMFWPQVRRRLRELSTARVLLASGRLAAPYVLALQRKLPLLYPTQVLAIEANRLLEPDRNALVTLPTSTGKSLLGELAILSALCDQKPLGVYLAPYRALASQLFSRMKERLAAVKVECVSRHGGYLSDRPINEDVRTVLVATPEAFDALLRVRPELRERLACCVFDEFHLIEQAQRGPRYEGLLGRLRGEPRTKIVALSPVVSSSKALREWIGLGEEDVTRSAWRPTARRLAIARPDRTAHYFSPGDQITEAFNANPAWTATIPFPTWLEPPRRAWTTELRQHRAALRDNIAAVAIDQYKRFNQPVLILSGTRAQTRTLSGLVAKQLPALPNESPASELASEVMRRCPYLFTLAGSLKRGIAYHNASLPNWIRDRLQDLMEKQALKLVAATTTLAEGVDLPFRVVVMADWRSWLFGLKRPMPTLLFRNIAGRCGRAGAFTEGDTIIVDNPGSAPGAKTFAQRYEDYLSLYIRPPEQHLRSAVAEAVDFGSQESGQRSLSEVDASLESQFLAFVALNHPKEGKEESEFTRSLFAGRFPAAASHVDGLTEKLVAAALRDQDFAILARSSPLTLTALGRGVLTTGLSPRSGMSLARFLRGYAPPEEPRTGKKLRQVNDIEWVPLLAALRAATEATDFVEELRSGDFNQIGHRGFPINGAIFLPVLLAWVSGLSVEQIALLTVRDKNVRAEGEKWLENLSGPPSEELEDQIEQVAAFLSGYVAQQWSWVLRGIAAIAEKLGNVTSGPAQQLAGRLEHGVRHELSAELLGLGCPMDRNKVDGLVARFRAAAPGLGASESTLLEWILANQTALVGRRVGRFRGSVLEGPDLDELVGFLRARTGT